MSADEQTLHAIMKDPGGHFSAPKDVLSSKELSDDQKKAVLESWQVDEQELAKATEENMGGSDNNLLDEVTAALSSLIGNKT